MSATCRQCGCTDYDACEVDYRLDGQIAGCSWVEPDLCSACAFPESRVRGPLMGAGRLRMQEAIVDSDAGLQALGIDIRAARERAFLGMSSERRVLAIQGLKRLAEKHPDSAGIADALEQARQLQAVHRG